MGKKILVIILVLTASFTILFISILRSASVKYTFTGPKPVRQSIDRSPEEIDYPLAYPGAILPDSIFWPIKMMRDRFWLIVTTDPLKKAELKLLFGDKRIGAAKLLFEREEYELGLTTLAKSISYLKSASDDEDKIREKGIDTTELTVTLVKASLKYREIIEGMLLIVPEDEGPRISELIKFTRDVYDSKSSVLRSKGIPADENPFGL